MPGIITFGKMLLDKLRFFQEQIEYVRNSSIGTPKRLYIDLGVANNNLELNISGNYFYVFDASSNIANADVKFNETREPPFNLTRRKGFLTPYHRLFITNTVQAGDWLVIVYGTQAPDFLEVIDNTSELADLGAILNQLQGDAGAIGFGRVAVGAGAGQIAAADATRKSILVQHAPDGVGFICLGFDNTVTVANYFISLAPGEWWSIDDYLGAVFAIRTAGATNAQYGEV